MLELVKNIEPSQYVGRAEAHIRVFLYNYNIIYSAGGLRLSPPGLFRAGGIIEVIPCSCWRFLDVVFMVWGHTNGQPADNQRASAALI